MKAGTVCLLVSLSLCYPDPTIHTVQSPARNLMMCRARGWLAKIIGKLSQSLLLLATQTLWLSIRGAQETWVLAVPLLLLLTENIRLYLSLSKHNESSVCPFLLCCWPRAELLKWIWKEFFYFMSFLLLIDNLESFYKLYLSLGGKAPKKQLTTKQD